MFHLFIFVIVTIAFICTTGGILSEFDGRNNADKICQPVDCKEKFQNCPYGYQKQDGCEICKCYDPCNPPGKTMICGANRRCFVDTKSNGIFVARCGLLRLQKNKNICAQKKVVGRCKGLFRRFYYDVTTKKCEQFIYGGCGGNENNFKSKDECETICINSFNHFFI